jgi:hypothetical protein
MQSIQMRRRRLQFSLRELLLSFIPVALVSALVAWLFRSTPIDVGITVNSLRRYDDGAGHHALGAHVRITNQSRSTVWYLGSPTYSLEELVDGKWQWSAASMGPDCWNPLQAKQSITITVGPVSEQATAIRMGIGFTTEHFSPSPHWVYSKVMNIRGEQRGEQRGHSANGT